MTIDLHTVRIDPSWLRVVLPPRPLTAVQAVAQRPKLRGLLAGAMFDARGLQYGALDGASGRLVPSRFPARGITLSVVKGVARAAEGWRPAPGATVAWQGYPTLVRGGRNVASHAIDTERVGRCAVAILAGGDLVLATATRAGMWEFAEALRAAGAVEAAYSDGGGSTVLLSRDRSAPWRWAPDPNLTERPLASFVASANPLEL